MSKKRLLTDKDLEKINEEVKELKEDVKDADEILDFVNFFSLDNFKEKEIEEKDEMTIKRPSVVFGGKNTSGWSVIQGDSIMSRGYVEANNSKISLDILNKIGPLYCPNGFRFYNDNGYGEPRLYYATID